MTGLYLTFLTVSAMSMVSAMNFIHWFSSLVSGPQNIGARMGLMLLSNQHTDDTRHIVVGSNMYLLLAVAILY